jgi:ABC-2 type transport system ATP-binding protein
MQMENINMLKIQNFTKIYGDKRAVDQLNLEISRGEICGFIGHNGAGKTTTLKACMGILSFDEGDIFIDGMSIKEHPLETKHITAYIPDNPDLYAYLSGEKYLNFIADVYGVSTESRNNLIKEYAEKFELTGELGAPIGTYSHGMKQKLAIIAAWLHSPKLIIMDEPFVGLDPKASHKLKEMMREHCERGGSIFFSTHVLDVAEKLCDKVAIIKNGKLVVTGSMEDVKGNDSLEEVFLDLEESDD